MEDELILDSNEEITREKDRNKKLADKVKTTSEERDAKVKELEEISRAKADTEKERDFFKNFNQVALKYPNATELQDKIWEKVKGGYDMEDATVAVLNKEGKFTPTAPTVERLSAAGGSATTNMSGGEAKGPTEMSQDERRNALHDLEARGELHL